MKSQFRATSPRDAAAVARFLQRVFRIDEDRPTVAPPHLHWKCWEARSDWSDSRGYAIFRENEILAHGTVVPLWCTSGGRRLKVVHLIEWAADPDSVGVGVRLLRQISRMVDVIIVVGGSPATQKILPVLGFETHGQVTRFARPLHPLRRLAGQDPSLRLAAQFARALVWSQRVPRVPVGGWSARPISADQTASAPIPWPGGRPGPTAFERTAEVMAYFLKCPATPMALFCVEKDGSPRGHFLLAEAPGQVRLVDFSVDSSDPADWRVLVQLAVLQAKQYRRAAELVSVGSDPVTFGALSDCGFHARDSQPLRLLACGGSVLPETPVRFQMIDSDAAYLHRNHNDFWA